MHRIWTIGLVFAIALAALGFHLHLPQPAASTADDIAVADTRVSDQAVMQLLTQHLLRALSHTDASRLAGLLTSDYQEAPARWNDPTGYILLGKRKRYLRRYINGKRRFLREFQMVPPSQLQKLRFRLIEWLPQGDAADCTLEAFAVNGQLQARIRLYFTREEDGWRLAMSDGLSLLARLTATAPQPQDSTVQESGRILFEQTAVPDDDRTFRFRMLLPQYRVLSLNRSVAAARWRQEMLMSPFAMAFLALSPLVPGNRDSEPAFMQLITDPGQNRVLYGHFRRQFKSYDALETGRRLQQPHGIAVDSRGYIYIADTGNARILIVKRSGRGENADLLCLRAFGEQMLRRPYALAWDDGGTLRDTTDDLLWVIDRGTGELLAFRASLLEPALVARYRHPDWRDPVAVAIGRFNGRSDGQLFVADQQAPALHRLMFDGKMVRPVQQLSLPQGSHPETLASDFWGNLYLSDTGHARVVKYAPDFTLLATLNMPGSAFAPLLFQPLFLAYGSLGGHPREYIGFNQGFALERWTSDTGLKRFKLGIDVQLQRVVLSADRSRVRFEGILTDTGHLSLKLIRVDYPEQRFELLRTWSPAGRFSWTWDRRESTTAFVPSGEYVIRLRAATPSGQNVSVREFGPITLPMFFRLEAGDALTAADFCIRGEIASVTVGRNQRIIWAHHEAVVFRFPMLDTGRRYDVRLLYLTEDSPVQQMASINGVPLHAPMKVGHSTQRTAWVAIPSEALSDAAMELRIEKIAGKGRVGVAAITLRDASAAPLQPLEMTLHPAIPATPLVRNAPDHGGP
ncbi:MAG: hypothetical protein Q9P90_04035 [candidate division KSB1 bacterium]|nr:hypothetical protein [candidate division KSB1 bacterium]